MTSPISVKQTPITLEAVMQQNLYRAIDEENPALLEHYIIRLEAYKSATSLVVLYRYAQQHQKRRCCTYLSQLIGTLANI